MSKPTIIAVILHLGTCLLCLITARISRKAHRPTRDSLNWLLCGFWFVGIALVRALGLEEKSRQSLRTTITEFGAYSDRTSFQIPLTILAILLGVFFLWLFLRQLNRTAGKKVERLILWSQFAALGFVPLFALRILSLHATDQILYRGGVFRLNWLLDGGLTLLVAGCAFLCARHYKRMRKRSRPA